MGAIKSLFDRRARIIPCKNKAEREHLVHTPVHEPVDFFCQVIRSNTALVRAGLVERRIKVDKSCSNISARLGMQSHHVDWSRRRPGCHRPQSRLTVKNHVQSGKDSARPPLQTVRFQAIRNASKDTNCRNWLSWIRLPKGPLQFQRKENYGN